MKATVELGEEEKKRGKETKVLKRKGKLIQGMGTLQMCVCVCGGGGGEGGLEPPYKLWYLRMFCSRYNFISRTFLKF